MYLIDIKKNSEIREIEIDAQNGKVVGNRLDLYGELDESQSEQYVEEISQVVYIDFESHLGYRCKYQLALYSTLVESGHLAILK